MCGKIVTGGELGVAGAVEMVAEGEKIRKLFAVCDGVSTNQKVKLVFLKGPSRGQPANILNLLNNQGRQAVK